MIPDIVKILNEYISTLTQTVVFKNVIDQGDGTFKIETCNTANLRPPKYIEIGSSGYTIESIAGTYTRANGTGIFGGIS